MLYEETINLGLKNKQWFRLIKNITINNPNEKSIINFIQILLDKNDNKILEKTIKLYIKYYNLDKLLELNLSKTRYQTFMKIYKNIKKRNKYDLLYLYYQYKPKEIKKFILKENIEYDFYYYCKINKKKLNNYKFNYYISEKNFYKYCLDKSFLKKLYEDKKIPYIIIDNKLLNHLYKYKLFDLYFKNNTYMDDEYIILIFNFLMRKGGFKYMCYNKYYGIELKYLDIFSNNQINKKSYYFSNNQKILYSYLINKDIEKYKVILKHNSIEQQLLRIDLIINKKKFLYYLVKENCNNYWFCRNIIITDKNIELYKKYKLDLLGIIVEETKEINILEFEKIIKYLINKDIDKLSEKLNKNNYDIIFDYLKEILLKHGFHKIFEKVYLLIVEQIKENTNTNNYINKKSLNNILEIVKYIKNPNLPKISIIEIKNKYYGDLYKVKKI